MLLITGYLKYGELSDWEAPRCFRIGFLKSRDSMHFKPADSQLVMKIWSASVPELKITGRMTLDALEQQILLYCLFSGV